ncbi:hypothetical protein ACFLR2_00395 [Chlamydiota bacterium]
MKKQHLLISLVGLMLGFMMVGAGTFLFLVQYVPAVKWALRSLILFHLEGLSACGLVLLFCGVLFLTALARLNQRRYFLLKMGGVSIEDRLLAHYAQESLQKFFPDQPVACEILSRAHGKIEIMANIPQIPEIRREHILSEIERALILMLRKQCQYERDFIFNVSFTTPVK